MDTGTDTLFFGLPHIIPTLSRDEDGDLLWVATDKATPAELRMYLGQRLWALWRDLPRFNALAAYLGTHGDAPLDVPALVQYPGPLPAWVTAIPEADYEALQRAWRGEED
jgi:hypothetical protein